MLSTCCFKVAYAYIAYVAYSEPRAVNVNCERAGRLRALAYWMFAADGGSSSTIRQFLIR